jgi:hypothetical protein
MGMFSKRCGARARKTAAALYRILRDEFESRRDTSCSCTMPMVLSCEQGTASDANWCVERLWCGSPSCHRALAEVVEDSGRRFELVESHADAGAPRVMSGPAMEIARLFEA